ncbi:hypothetical protein MRBLWH7_000341 [Microbacterium sp. LWH7-1.2]|uniref:hypothetical protein n=1 Tax=Microbacterium sp. LWH7-1.2 TaxID=3135257 RepID=UPI003139ADA3
MDIRVQARLDLARALRLEVQSSARTAATNTVGRMIFVEGAPATGGGWDWGLTWTIVGAVAGSLALIGVFVTFVGYRRQFPKRRMAFGFESRSLLRPHDLPRGDLEVRVRGTVLDEPHFVELQIWSESRADIPSASFDAGHPITLDVLADNVIPVLSWGEIGVDVATRPDGRGVTVTIAPQLIRKRAHVSMTLMSDGAPRVEPSSSLIDIPLVKKYDSADRLERPGIINFYIRLFRTRWFVWSAFVYLALVVSGLIYLVLQLAG